MLHECFFISTNRLQTFIMPRIITFRLTQWL